MCAIYRCVAVLLSSLLLVSCGAAQFVKDSAVEFGQRVLFAQIKTLKLDLVARHVLNPDDTGRSLSVVMRVYQLIDPVALQNLAYDDFIENDQKILGPSLLMRKEVVLPPGGALSIDEPMDNRARYIAVVAFFRQVDKGGAWRLWFAKDKLSNHEPVKVEARRYRLEMLN